MKNASADQPYPTLAESLNRIRPGYGDTYQNGVEPGPRKLAQFQEVLRITATPALLSQESNPDAFAFVKFFDPCGSWTWYVTEWDGDTEAFGLVCGEYAELGYISLTELASFRGALGIGIELDMHWSPRPLSRCRTHAGKPE